MPQLGSESRIYMYFLCQRKKPGKILVHREKTENLIFVIVWILQMLTMLLLARGRLLQ